MRPRSTVSRPARKKCGQDPAAGGRHGYRISQPAASARRVPPHGMMKLKSPPQSAELVSNILCRPALSFGSTTNANRRGRTLTVAFSIVVLEVTASYLNRSSSSFVTRVFFRLPPCAGCPILLRSKRAGRQPASPIKIRRETSFLPPFPKCGERTGHPDLEPIFPYRWRCGFCRTRRLTSNLPR